MQHLAACLNSLYFFVFKTDGVVGLIEFVEFLLNLQGVEDLLLDLDD